MNAWLVRGLALAVLIVAVRTLLGFAIGEWPLHGTPMRLLSLLVVIVAALVWGLLDARRDRAANPGGSDQGTDLTMLWLKAGVLAGLAGGVLAWIVDKIGSFDLGDNPLFFELSASAAFFILLTFIPAMIGVGIGHLLANRAENKEPVRKRERSPEPVAVGASGGYENESSEYDESIFPSHSSGSEASSHSRRGEADAVTEEFPAINDESQNGRSS
jgi:uncharacterized protein YneF (UPF0154 family)